MRSKTMVSVLMIFAVVIGWRYIMEPQELSLFTAAPYRFSPGLPGLSLSVVVYNDPESALVYPGKQQLIFRVTISNLSNSKTPGMSIQACFSEIVADYLDRRVSAGFSFATPPLEPLQTVSHEDTTLIGVFNGDATALQEASKLLRDPLLMRISSRRESEILHLTPEVSLSLFEDSATVCIPPLWRLLEERGSLKLYKAAQNQTLCLENTETRTVSRSDGLDAALMDSGKIAYINLLGELIVWDPQTTRYQTLATDCRGYVYASASSVAVSCSDVGGNKVVIIDTEDMRSTSIRVPETATLQGWIGNDLMVFFYENEDSVTAHLLTGSDALKPALTDILPKPLGKPVWKNCVMAYETLGSRVVIVDFSKPSTYIVEKACEPVWVEQGLLVRFESIGRVVRVD